MAITVTNQATPLGAKIVNDTSVGATAVINVTGASGNLFYVEIDNTANSSTTYLKMVRAASATPSSTGPDTILSAPASTVAYFAFPTAMDQLYITYWATSTAANGTSQTAPSSSVTVRFLCKNS